MAVTSFTTGKENDLHAHTSVHAFALFPGTNRTDHIGKANTAGVCQQLAGHTWQPAVEGADYEVGGAWCTANYEMQEGLYVKLKVEQKTRWGEVPFTQCVWLRCMQSADLVVLTIRLTGSPNALRDTVQVRGRFRVVPFEEVQRLGVNVGWRAQYKALDAPDSLISLSVQERGHRANRRAINTVPSNTVRENPRNRRTTQPDVIFEEVNERGESRPMTDEEIAAITLSRTVSGRIPSRATRPTPPAPVAEPLPPALPAPAAGGIARRRRIIR